MRRFSLHLDWVLLSPVLLLVILSLTTLFSINSSYFVNQFFYVVLSLVAYVFFSQLDFRNTQALALPIYIISFILLFILLIVGIESRGAVRWVDIFGIRLQFSEVLKPFLLLSLASFLANRPTNLKTLLQVLFLLLPLAIFINRQPDLGNAIIYAVVVGITLVAAGFPFRWFGIGAAAFALLLPFSFQFLHEYQKQRVLTFLNPTNDPQGSSYNAIQAIIAVGSGKILGKGIGEGTQSSLRFLPERQTDFIFATLAEQFGFISSLVVLALFAFLFYRIFTLYVASDDAYSKIFAISAIALLLFQFFVNVGMNIGLVPIVGVTLPFVSYGGSSMLSNFILLGLLASMGNFYRRQSVLEIR